MLSNHLAISPVPIDYLRDESRKTGFANTIAFPCNTDELSAAVQLLAAKQHTITIQGARTGIAGGAVPKGHAIINLSKMDRIFSANTSDRLRVQPGVTLATVRHYLAYTHAPSHGFFFAPDPTESSATLGGMAACNASGACSYAYGSTRQHLEALTGILADGDRFTLRRGLHQANGRRFSIITENGRELTGTLPELNMPAVKNAAGYWIKRNMDLIDLLIGSEGTLAILAKLELRLTPSPAGVCGMLCFFKSVNEAITCVSQLQHTPNSNGQTALLTAIEYFDTHALRLIRESASYTGLLLPKFKSAWHAALYLEWALPTPDSLPLNEISQLLTACGGDPQDTWLATDAPSLEKLKLFRHAVPEEVNRRIGERKQVYPELTKLGTDFSVPNDCLLQVMQRYQDDLNTAGLEHVIFGHIGNNHLHVNILPRNMEEYATGKRLYRAWAEQVVTWGGSVSAEHGIGQLKCDLLALMYGPTGLAAMQHLKQIFDPTHRLNPGCLFMNAKGSPYTKTNLPKN